MGGGRKKLADLHELKAGKNQKVLFWTVLDVSNSKKFFRGSYFFYQKTLLRRKKGAVTKSRKNNFPNSASFGLLKVKFA